MICEQCGQRLSYAYNPAVSDGANAARAQRVGVIVKLFTLHGDNHGFRFFCSIECATNKRQDLFPNSDTLQNEIDETIKTIKANW